MRVGALHDWPLLLKQARTPPFDIRGEIRIVEHDVRRLAAKLLRDALHRVGSRLGHLSAGARRTGERHHVDARMRRHRRADHRTLAVDEVEDACGNARLVHDLSRP